MLKQAGRRLLVSPWFAAGAGFVIATGAVIYMPHSQLDPAINITHCKGASCEPTQLTPQVGAKPLPVGTGAPIPVPSPSLPAGMSFWYQPGHSAQGEFSMWIEIRSRDSLGQWQLSFHVPGATSIWVYWPRWQLSGIDGVTVSSYYAGTESAGYAQISAHEAGSAGELSRGGYTVLFQIRGMGTPGPPTHCTYNGATCQFKPSGGLSSAAWPGFG